MTLQEMAKEGAEIQARNEAEAFENAMSKAFKVNDEVEAAYRQGYAAGVKSIEEKHWNECRQIAQYDDQLRKLKAGGGDNA